MSEVSVPLWLTLGKTRVGKGEFIKTAVKKCTGVELDITSDRLESHTKTSTRYPFILGGKDVAMVDTVGYDDSDGDDQSCAAFLKLLAETGKDLFYPPLVILTVLGGSDKEWLKRIRSVFPSFVCAIRCTTKAFSSAQKSWQDSDFHDLKLLHLHQFIDVDDDDGRSYGRYISDVEAIVAYYSQLTPSRQDLNFDCDLFKGDYCHVYLEKEIKTDDFVSRTVKETVHDAIIKREKIIEVDAGGHFEEKEVVRDGMERATAAIKSLLLLGIDGWSKTRIVQQWVKDRKEISVDDSYVQKMTTSYLEVTTTHVHSDRDVYEVWKVLAGGLKVFKGIEYSDWKQFHKEIVDVHSEPIPENYEQQPVVNSKH